MLKAIQIALNSANYISPRLSARLAMSICKRPQKFRRSKREIDQMQKAQREFYIDGRGEQNPIWLWGSGPVVILCHGWSGKASQMATLAQAIAKNGFTAVTFDCHAHGEATGRVSGFDAMAQDILQLAKQFPRIYAVVGHSMGGMMSMYCRRLGLNAEKYVLLGAPCAPLPIINKMDTLLKVPAPALRICEQHIAKEFEKTWQELVNGDIYRNGDKPALLVYDEQDDELVDSQYHLDVITKNYAQAEVHKTHGLGHYKTLWDEAVIKRVISFIGNEITAVKPCS